MTTAIPNCEGTSALTDSDKNTQTFGFHAGPLTGPEPFGLPVTDHHHVPAMTLTLAHAVMQRHIDCPINVCPIKQQAKAHLVTTQRLIPADRPHMGY